MLRWALPTGCVLLACWAMLALAQVDTAMAGEMLPPARDLSDTGLVEYAGSALGKSRQSCGTVESAVRFREGPGQDSVFAACSSGHVFLFHSALKWKPIDCTRPASDGRVSCVAAAEPPNLEARLPSTGSIGKAKPPKSPKKAKLRLGS